MTDGGGWLLKPDGGFDPSTTADLSCYAQDCPPRIELADDLQEKLHAIIETDIIPQLMWAGRTRAEKAPEVGRQADPPTHEQVTELAALLVKADEGASMAYVEAVRSQGNSGQTLFLHLLAPAARHLGDLWTEDLCSFADVTIGLCRLHRILRELGATDSDSTLDIASSRRVLLAPTPGEQHIFGIAMAAELFRSAGWEVQEQVSATTRELAELVLSQHFDVVGLSASCESRMDTLKEAISAIRSGSVNDRIGVIVGGRLFVDRPDLARRVGADLTAGDGREAPLHAESLVRLRSARL